MRLQAPDKMPPACQEDVEELCEGSRDDSFHLMCLRKVSALGRRVWAGRGESEGGFEAPLHHGAFAAEVARPAC